MSGRGVRVCCTLFGISPAHAHSAFGGVPHSTFALSAQALPPKVLALSLSRAADVDAGPGASAQNPLGRLCFGQSAVGFRRVWFASGAKA